MSLPVWGLQAIGLFVIVLVLLLWPTMRALKSNGGSIRNEVIVLYVAFSSRMLIAVLNIMVGPLPGAEVDAIAYLFHADRIRGLPSIGESVSIEDPRFTVGAIVGALARIVELDVDIVYGVVNALLTAGGGLVILRILALFDLKESVQLRIAIVSIMFPQSVLYTGVPLREAAIFFSFALVMWWCAERVLHGARLLDPRVAVALPVLAYLHSGFVALMPMMISIIITRDARKRLNANLRGLLLRGAIPALLALILVAPYLGKIPSNPADLFDLDVLLRSRRVKASYGDGYLGSGTASPIGFILQLPAIFALFISVPVPFISLSGAGLYKMIDALATVSIVGGVIWEWRHRPPTLDPKHVAVLRAFLAGLVGLWLFFAIGTANVGIAIRHRNKMIWLALLTYQVLRVLRRRHLQATPELEKASVL